MERMQLAVVGAGIAGTSAAIEAARAGLQVTLIDENPIPFGLMTQDIPLHFGQRMLATVKNRATMLGRVVAANPLLQQAEEAGVDVRLGTVVWSSDRDATLALADDEHSSLLTYERAIFAPGARDLGMAFPGWDLAGVMGAAGALVLMDRYEAFSGRRLAVLGSGDLGLQTACRALEMGLEVTAVVEASSSLSGRAELRERLERADVPFYVSHTVTAARGPGEVDTLAIARIDDRLKPEAGTEREIACDTVCLAMGLVPNIELVYWTGCELTFESARGGFVPLLDENMRTTVEAIYVVGDGAGYVEGRFPDPGASAAQGRLAAVSAAESLGALDTREAASIRAEIGSPPVDDGARAAAYRQTWFAALDATDDVPVCLCEGVTRRDLVEMMARGPQHPDHIKRVTRAGMGYCQGRRCRELIQMLVGRETNTEVARIPLASYRPPFRPLPLKIVQNHNETPEERKAFEGTWWRRRRREFLKQKGGDNTGPVLDGLPD